MTTRRKYDELTRLRRVESLSTATGASRVSFDSPGARKAKMPGECVAEYGVGLELHVLPPQIPALNPDELLWNAFFWFFADWNEPISGGGTLGNCK